MSNFAEWFEGEMFNIGYALQEKMDNEECTWMQFNYKSIDPNVKFHVFYAKKPLTEAIIRTTFAMKNEPILFVVDRAAIDEYIYMKGDRPLWVRALHAIYFGRIYVWARNVNMLQGLHFEWDINNLKFSPAITIDRINFEHVESKLKAFPGNYYVAMLGDRAFWKQEQPKKEPKESWKERAKKQREEWEQATKGHAEKDYQNSQWYQEFNRNRSSEDVYEAFKQAFREHMRSHGVDYDTPRQRYTPQGDKWFMMLVECGSLVEAKKKYKQLALEYHPDRNSNGLETMKAINAAYDKVRQYFK